MTNHSLKGPRPGRGAKRSELGGWRSPSTDGPTAPYTTTGEGGNP